MQNLLDFLDSLLDMRKVKIHPHPDFPKKKNDSRALNEQTIYNNGKGYCNYQT